ncbi:MAG: hypothetical protein MUO77_11700, partial [Anaerolineales bacterium]|nr:hypothetical protein [Anaerolineales bacterium]
MKTLRCIFLGLIFLFSACSNTLAVPIAKQAVVPILPSALPDTPAPVGINAAIEEVPTFTGIHMLNEMDGWAVTETQIVRT